MLTKSDLSQIKKIVDISIDPVKQRVGVIDERTSSTEIKVGLIEKRTESIEKKVGSIEQRVEVIEKDIKNIKRNVRKINKTTSATISHFDHEDVQITKRVRGIEDHLGITA